MTAQVHAAVALSLAAVLAQAPTVPAAQPANEATSVPAALAQDLARFAACGQTRRAELRAYVARALVLPETFVLDELEAVVLGGPTNAATVAPDRIIVRVVARHRDASATKGPRLALRADLHPEHPVEVRGVGKRSLGGTCSRAQLRELCLAVATLVAEWPHECGELAACLGFSSSNRKVARFEFELLPESAEGCSLTADLPVAGELGAAIGDLRADAQLVRRAWQALLATAPSKDEPRSARAFAHAARSPSITVDGLTAVLRASDHGESIWSVCDVDLTTSAYHALLQERRRHAAFRQHAPRSFHVLSVALGGRLLLLSAPKAAPIETTPEGAAEWIAGNTQCTLLTPAPGSAGGDDPQLRARAVQVRVRSHGAGRPFVLEVRLPDRTIVVEWPPPHAGRKGVEPTIDGERVPWEARW